MNPLVTQAQADGVERVTGDPRMPRYPQPDGRVKLAAGWLIERAGFRKGERRGAVGLSSRHALAIVCHDGARASDVLAFAREIQAAVEARLGVALTPEPVFF
jgi:UDP-N-acetylmuramate dehydrogenase